MSKGIVETVGGAAMIAAGVLVMAGSIVFPNPATQAAALKLAPQLIMAGAGMVMSGISTLDSGASDSVREGVLTSVRNPLSPWNVIYGQQRIKGTCVYINSFGDSDKYLDMIFVLAAHSCHSVDGIYFDNQRVLMTPGTPYNLAVPSGLQSNVPISSIARSNNVVTFHVIVAGYVLAAALIPGDKFVVSGITGDRTLNGIWSVNTISITAGVATITYISGGLPYSVTGEGQFQTFFPNYSATSDGGSRVYAETMLGTQTLGTTFVGESTGTVNAPPANFGVVMQNPPWWNNNCSLLGKTAIMLRLHYNDQVFANGLPQFSFLVSGKNDIYDSRTSTTGYTTNAALCIADFLSNTTWGYKAAYHTEIPDTPLNTAANMCDDNVPLNAGGTEKRYTCNGGFNLDQRRGEILKSMLSSCGGRVTYVGGQYVIWPAGYFGTVGTILSNETWPNYADSISAITGTSIYSLASGAFRWKSKVSYSELYNGVRGTYISPQNNWQPADFPWYAQDPTHGYSSDLNLIEDGNDRRWKDISLPFTISSSMAQRLAKIDLLRTRQQGTGTFLLNMAGYQFAPMDVIAMDLPYFGWTGQLLEIQNVRLKFEKREDSAFLMGVEIDVQETDPSVYFWSDGEELTPAGYQQVLMPDTRNPQCPTNILLSSEFGDIFVTWTPPNDGYVLQGGHIEIEYQLVASPEGLWYSLGKMDPTLSSATITGLTGGAQYNVRMRAVNAAGIPCDWDYGSPFDTSPPTPGPITVLADVEPFGQWMPYNVLGTSTDALYPNEYTFDFALQYPFGLSGSPLPQVAATGILPVDQFIPNCGPVEAPLSGLSVSTTGGSIPGGVTVYCQICAVDALGRYSPPSVLLVIGIPVGTNTNQFTMYDLVWPTLPGLTGWVVFANTDQELLCGQQTGMFGSPPTFPSSITVNGPFVRTSYAAPNPAIATLRLKGRRLIHGGPVGGVIYSFDTTSITDPGIADLTGGGSPPTYDNWAGRKLVIIGRAATSSTPPGGSISIPFAAFNITSFNHSTGQLTLDRDPSAIVKVGDVFVITFLGYDNSANPYDIADAGISNATNPMPHTGETPNDPNRIGNYVLVIQGLSRGQSSKITANGTTDYTLSSALTIDSTSVWIVVNAAWEDFSDVPVNNADPTKKTTILMDVSNYNNLPVLVGAQLVDGTGSESDPTDMPVRMGFVIGAQGTRLVVSNDSMTPLDGHVTFNTSSVNPADYAVAPSTTTLTGNILSTDTNIPIADGSKVVNGTCMDFPASPGPDEHVLVTSGGGTSGPVTLTVERAHFGGGPAVALSSGTTVNVAGQMNFNLLPLEQVPNLQLTLSKITGDINFIKYIFASGDMMLGGATYGLLVDNGPLATITFKVQGN